MFLWWYVVNARLMLVLEVCSMWKLCPKSGSHTHTHTLHHQPLRTIQYWFNHNQYQFNSIYHKSSFKKLSPIISNPKESFQVSMTPKDCMKLSLPTAGIRVPIAIQAIPTSYTPWILCVAMAKFMYFCYHPYIYIKLYKCSSKSYPKTSNEIIKVYHKSNLIAFSVNGILPKYIINYQSQACMWANVPLHWHWKQCSYLPVPCKPHKCQFLDNPLHHDNQTSEKLQQGSLLFFLFLLNCSYTMLYSKLCFAHSPRCSLQISKVPTNERHSSKWLQSNIQVSAHRRPRKGRVVSPALAVSHDLRRYKLSCP